MTVSSKDTYISIAIIGVLFFIFGFVTWLNGILIPYLQIACELSNYQALFVTFAFYISYTVMALPSSWVLNKTGFKKGMMVGLIVMALGTLVFIPAAITRLYGLFLVGLFIQGTGLALLQTASNPYITIIGPSESAARRISIMGIANKVAGMLAPLILAYFILHDGDELVSRIAELSETARSIELDALSRRVIPPYAIMATALTILGIVILYSPLPEIDEEEDNNGPAITNNKKSVFSYPNLILGVIALFVYVGVEVIAGDTIIRYGMSLNFPIDQAKLFTSFTLAGMIIGYVLGIVLIPKIISQQKALALSALLGIFLSVVVVFGGSNSSVLSVALLGLANALVWPAIWPLAIHGLGSHIKTGSAMLIMAIAGGAIMPLLWGRLSDIFNPQQAYWILIPSYLFIYVYAVWGYKLTKW